MKTKTQYPKRIMTVLLTGIIGFTLTACTGAVAKTSQKSVQMQNSGYQTTASGLKYRVITAGKGQSPSASDTVTVHYEGRLTNGQVFDSSYQRGQPATFPLNAVIKGWTEGLQLMQEGDKYEFYIPANLAYGSRSNGKIPANSPLIFMVELVKVQ